MFSPGVLFLLFVIAAIIFIAGYMIGYASCQEKQIAVIKERKRRLKRYARINPKVWTK